jgi:dTDP-4-amino-4,6-dideoxygalactose transaminase
MIDAGVYSGGKELTIFEDKLKELTGSLEVIPCSNGTDALEIALKVLGIGQGDEVLIPAMTWVSTAEAVCLVGAKPVFVDTDTSGLIDLRLLDIHLSSATKAVIPVHLYGKMVDMKALNTWAKSRKILVIEDAAQALGSKMEGKSAGTWGNIGCMSFYPTKNLGALGEAGALLTQDKALAESMRQFVNHGQIEKGNHVSLGRNARMDTLQAGFLNLKLQYFEQWQSKRKAITRIYLEAFRDLDIILPSEIMEEHHNAHLFVIQTEKRDTLAQILNEVGIGTAIHYPVIIPKMQPYADVKEYPVAEALSKRILSLPLNPWMGRWDFEAVIKMVKYAYSKTS